MDNKRLSPEEFIKLPFSSAIRLVIQDVKDFTANGVKLYMNSWVSFLDTHICSVCLGGAAIMSYNPGYTRAKNDDAILDIAEDLGIDRGLADRITDAFNYLRGGGLLQALAEWLDLERWDIREISSIDITYRFNDYVAGSDLEYMYTTLHRVADGLQALGY